MRVNVKRTWTWNGVAGSGGEETSTASLASPSTSDSIASVSGNTLTVSSLGTTFKAATTITVSAQTEHDTTRVSATVTQAANYVTDVAIKASTFSYGTIGAGGGTMNPTVPGNGTLTYTFSSGSSTTTTPTAGGAETRVITFSMSAGNGFTGINTSSGAVTASSKGTTISGVTTSNTITRTLSATFKNNAAYGGTTVTGTGSSTTTCSQAANNAEINEIIISKCQHDNTWYSADSWGSIPAGPSTYYLGIKTQNHQKYTSGSEFTVDKTINPSTDFIITGGFASVHNELGIKVGSRGTTVGGSRTGTVRVLYSGIYSNILSFTQAANAVTKYGIPSGRQLSVPTIPASGGTVSKGTWSGTIKQSRTFTSGDSDTLTNPTVTAERWSSPVSAGKIGAVDKPATPVGSITGYYTCNGVEVSVGVTVTQEANYIDTSKTKITCDGTMATKTFTYVSGATETETEPNSYYCGYRETIGLSVSVMQSGILQAPVFKSLQAWACRTGNVQGQGTSTVTFSNPKFGNNAATLSLSESEKNYGYVLFQLQMTYTDSSGAGAIPNYVWSGAVTYSGSLAIYTKANATNANVTVSAATRSAAADAAVASDVPAASGNVAADATALLERIGSGELKVPDGLAERLREMADGTDDGK